MSPPSSTAAQIWEAVEVDQSSAIVSNALTGDQLVSIKETACLGLNSWIAGLFYCSLLIQNCL